MPLALYTFASHVSQIIKVKINKQRFHRIGLPLSIIRIIIVAHIIRTTSVSHLSTPNWWNEWNFPISYFSKIYFHSKHVQCLFTFFVLEIFYFSKKYCIECCLSAKKKNWKARRKVPASAHRSMHCKENLATYMYVCIMYIV